MSKKNEMKNRWVSDTVCVCMCVYTHRRVCVCCRMCVAQQEGHRQHHHHHRHWRRVLECAGHALICTCVHMHMRFVVPTAELNRYEWMSVFSNEHVCVLTLTVGDRCYYLCVHVCACMYKRYTHAHTDRHAFICTDERTHTATHRWWRSGLISDCHMHWVYTCAM